MINCNKNIDRQKLIKTNIENKRNYCVLEKTKNIVYLGMKRFILFKSKINKIS